MDNISDHFYQVVLNIILLLVLLIKVSAKKQRAYL